MKTSYRELDYAYGEAMQKLRNAIGLTQAGLADRIGVSWRTVAGWEAGSSYPRAEHLKELIALAVQQQAFSVGHEAEEIRVLWKVAHQKMWLDEHWLSSLLDQRNSSHPHVEPPHGATVGTGLAPVLGASSLPTPTTTAKEAISSASVKSGSLDNDESDKEENDAEVAGHSMPESLDENDHSQESHHCSVQTSSQTSADQPQRSPIVEAESAQGTISTTKTRKRRKLLIYILIALAILTIIGSVGTLFFQAREQAHRTAAAQAYPGYLSGNGTLAFFDPLSQEDRWHPGSHAHGSSCQFTGGAYHVSERHIGYFGWCLADGIFGNFAFEVQLTITQGDCGGMTFRDDSNGNFDKFIICQDGTYMVSKYISNSGSTLRWSNRSAIRTGSGQQNKMAVVASGSTMIFYVNERQVDQEQDSSYTPGKIGLLAHPYYPDGGHVTEVAYSNARLWTL